MIDSLIGRIESGLSTEVDARIVSSIIARMAAYDLALREIAAHGTGEMAMLARRVLSGGENEPASQV